MLEHNFPCVSCRQMSVARWNVDEVGNYHHGDQLFKSRSKMCEMRCFPWLLITFFWQNQVSINSVSRSWSEFNCWTALCRRPPGARGRRGTGWAGAAGTWSGDRIINRASHECSRRFHNHREGRRLLLGLSSGWKCLLALSHLRHYAKWAVTDHN